MREARSLYEQILQYQEVIEIKAQDEAKLLKAQGLDTRRRARAEAMLPRAKQKADKATEVPVKSLCPPGQAGVSKLFLI